MNAEEIRALAVERIAESLFLSWAKGRYIEGYVWADCEEVMRLDFLDHAGRIADSLGDMLPTEAWWAIAWTNKYGERERQTASIESREDVERFREDYAERFPEMAASLRVERRYISDWQEVAE